MHLETIWAAKPGQLTLNVTKMEINDFVKEITSCTAKFVALDG